MFTENIFFFIFILTYLLNLFQINDMESQDHFIDIYTRICKIKINMLILLDLIIIKHNFIILYFNFYD